MSPSSSLPRPVVRRGDVILVAFPCIEILASKIRPALVVSRDDSEYLLVAFITRQQRHLDAASVVALGPGTPGFAGSGLKRASIIRLDRLATVNLDMVEARLGRLTAAAMNDVATSLRHALDLWPPGEQGAAQEQRLIQLALGVSKSTADFTHRRAVALPRIEHHTSTDHRLQDLDLGDLRRLDLQRVLGEHDVVRQPARLQ